MVESKIIKLLEQVQSADPNSRIQAELGLRDLEKYHDFAAKLTDIASSGASVPLRQGSLIYLQRYIVHHWSPLFEQFQDGPIPDENVKKHVRETLLHLLVSLDNFTLIKAVAYAVSLIANVDYPDEWPEVVPAVLHLLQSTNENSINASLDVLDELVDESLVEEQFFIIAPQLASILYQFIFSAPPNDSMRMLQARGIKLFRSCLELIEIYKETKAEHVRVFLEQILPPWMDMFSHKFEVSLVDDRQVILPDSCGYFCIMGEIAMTLTKLRELFPSKLTPYVVTFVELVWNIIEKLLDPYIREVVFSDGLDDSAFGDKYPIRYLVELLLFVSVALQSKFVQNLFVSNTVPVPPLPPCIPLLVQYTQLPKHQIEVYESDVSEYIANEFSMDFGSDTVRGAAISVLSAFEEHTTLPIQQSLREMSATYILNNEINWIYQEALLYACCSVDAASDDTYDDYLDPIYEAIKVRIDYSDAPILLLSRFFLFIGYFSESTVVASQFFQIIMNNLVNALQVDTVQYAAMKAIERFCSVGKVKPILSLQPMILEVLSQYASKSSDEALVLLVEAISSAVKLDCAKAAELGNSVIPLLFNLVATNASDPYICGIIEDTFEDIIHAANNYESMCEITLPELLQVLNQEDPIMVNIGATLLSCLIRAGPSPLPNGFVGYVLPPVYKITQIHSGDTELLQLTQEILKGLLEKDTPQLLETEISGSSGFQYILFILHQLLDKESDDSACFLVGPILLELADHASQMVDLQSILLSCIKRLAIAEQPRFIQSIIYVFAKLIVKDSLGMMHFLTSSLLNEQGLTAFEVLMTVWCDNFVYFSNFKNISIICIAMTKIYSFDSPLLDSVQVKGELISHSNRIITRSQSKLHPEEYSYVSVGEKILRLLSEEFVSLSKDAIVEEVSDDGADDWDDGPISAETFGLSANDVNELSKDEFSGVDNSEDEDNTDLQFYLLEFFKEAMKSNLHNINEVVFRLPQEEQDALVQIKEK